MKIASSYECTVQYKTPTVEVEPEDFKEFGYEGDSDEEFLAFLKDFSFYDAWNEMEEDHKLYDIFASLNGEEDWELWDDSSWNGREEEIIDFAFLDKR